MRALLLAGFLSLGPIAGFVSTPSYAVSVDYTLKGLGGTRYEAVYTPIGFSFGLQGTASLSFGYTQFTSNISVITAEGPNFGISVYQPDPPNNKEIDVNFFDYSVSFSSLTIDFDYYNRTDPTQQPMVGSYFYRSFDGEDYVTQGYGVAIRTSYIPYQAPSAPSDPVGPIIVGPSDPTSPSNPATPVPEPASLALLGVGVAGVAAARRRRKMTVGGQV